MSPTSRLRIGFCLFITVLLFCAAMSFHGWLKPDAISSDSWFSRIGAIVTLISLIVELYIVRSINSVMQLTMDDLIEIKNIDIQLNSENSLLSRVYELKENLLATKNELRTLVRWFESLAIVSVIVGTFQWAFGDVFYNHF